MATTSPGAEGKLRFSHTEQVENVVESQLKRRYGRGVYVESYRQSSDGTIFITLGNSVPKDVSDCRDRDRVLKFIDFGDIHTMKAESIGEGYLIELPDRDDLYDGYKQRRRELARRLDQNMARTIYHELVSFTPVENQLGAIKEILRTVREYAPLPEETIYEIRGSGNEEQTQRYLRLLDDVEFISIRDENEGRTIYSGPNLDAHDEDEIRTHDFSKVVLGQVVNRAYHTLKNELNLTLLAHYPKYANSYYFSALQRGEPNLHLDVETAHMTLDMLYEESVHEITVRQKLDDLANVGVLETEDDYYLSNPDVYQSLVEQPV